MQSVVSVLPQWPRGRARLEEPEGSGVVVLDGRHIVTAMHVVAPALSVRVRLNSGEVLAAEIVARDAATDLALLRVDADLVPVDLSARAELGEEVCAIGNVFGLGLSISCSVVSAVGRTGTGFNAIEDFVQTDASVNPGASGGALVRGDGAVVGILSAIFTKQSDANLGVNFAVAAPLAERVARELKELGRVRWLDAGMELAGDLSRGDTGLPGARVVSLDATGAAARAGIEAADVIVSAGGRQVRKPSDFDAALAYVSPPGELAVVLMRNGAERTVTLHFPDQK